MGESVLWGRGEEHFRSGHSKCKGPQVEGWRGRQGPRHGCFCGLNKGLRLYSKRLGKQGHEEI